MKKCCLIFLLFSLIFLISGCKKTQSLPEYRNQVIYETYFHEDIGVSMAEFSASYPIFEDPRYKDFNKAIVDHEVSAWMKIYDEICAQADEDIEVDPMLATFHRYLEVDYCVEMIGDELSVTFSVNWMLTLCNYEPSYKRTYTFSDGMIHATTVTCERVY